MTRRDVTLSIVATACVASAVVVTILSRGSQADTESLDRTTFWLCREETCGKEFVLSLRELDRIEGRAAQDLVPCPSCGKKNTARAGICHVCQRYLELWGHGSLPPKCLHCGHELNVEHGDSTHTHGPMTPHEAP